MSVIRLNIVSMWGAKRSAVVELEARSTVSQLKEEIKKALALEAHDLKLERSVLNNNKKYLSKLIFKFYNLEYFQCCHEWKWRGKK